MYCFKAAEGILASIASMRVVASNREFGQPTLRTAQHKLASIAEQIELERTTSAKGQQPTSNVRLEVKANYASSTPSMLMAPAP
jgi:hypothetical protein